MSERRLILKTCGSTRLLAALPTILQLAADYGGLDQVPFLAQRLILLRKQKKNRWFLRIDCEAISSDRLFVRDSS